MKRVFFALLSLLSAEAVIAEPIKLALTFDDGYDHHLTLVAPLLEKYGYSGAFNIVAENIGNLAGRLSWDGVRELKRRGHAVYNHSCTHANLERLIEAGRTNEAKREIEAASESIARELGEAPKVFCFPYNAAEGVFVKHIIIVLFFLL